MDLKASSFLKVPKYTYGAYHKVYTKHCLAEDHLPTYRQFQIQMDLKVPRYTCGTNHKVYTKYCPAEVTFRLTGQSQMTGLPENQTRIKNILTYNDGVLVCLRSDPVSRGVPPGNPGGTLGSPVPSGSCGPAERSSHLGCQIDSKIEAEIPLSGIFFIAALDARGISPPIVHTQSGKQS